MSTLHLSGGQPVTFAFANGGVSVVLPNGAAVPLAPSPAPAATPAAEAPAEPAVAAPTDHCFEVPKDMSPLVGSDAQSWTSGGTAGVLPAERTKATFDMARMTEAIYGGKENVAKRKFVLAPSKMNSLPMLQKYNMSREEVTASHFADFIKIHKSFTKKGYRPEPEETAWMSACSTNSGTLTTHMGLFLPTLVAQTNTAQQMQWVPRCMKFQIIGAYAQTELGHGSNVRALQTTCTFDPATQDFVLHTPTLQSAKFWNSGVGVAATHCVCYAQLITKGVCWGVHVFFVQLRDEHHRTLPGVEIGDCGNKLGDNGIDCGYIRFDRVHIPREHLLGKKAHVEKDGTYVKHVAKEGEDPKAAERNSYMTMLTARANMIGTAAGKLAMAATTAVRYSCVRQQGFVNTDKNQTFASPEKQIIDYQMQAYRLFKQLSISFAIQFSSRWMMMRFTQLSKKMWKIGFEEEKPDDGDEDQGLDLPEIHASAAGLKGLACRLAADGMEDCRKCCGGHGYLLASGIAGSWADYVWQATAEGDLVVMLLQTARFLRRSLLVAREGGELSGMMGYLRPFRDAGFNPAAARGTARARTAAAFGSLDNLAELLRVRSMVALSRADRILEEHMAKGMTLDQAWQASSFSLVSAAERHCYYFMFAKFAEAVAAETDGATAAALRDVCVLYGLTQVVEGSGWGGILDGTDTELAEEAVSEVLMSLRPNAVALVDAWDIPDRVLNSALGRADGNVYEAIMEHARDSPLNKTGPFTGYYDVVRPNLDLGFLELRGQAPQQLVKSMQPRKKKVRKSKL